MDKLGFSVIRAIKGKNRLNVSQTKYKRNGISRIITFITARVRSTREGTVFTGVCLLTFRGGGAPRPGLDGWGGIPHPGLDGGGGPHLRSGGGTLSRSGWWGGYPSQVWGGGVPYPKGGGYPGQVLMVGVPHPRGYLGTPS